jgi:ComF family protein
VNPLAAALLDLVFAPVCLGCDAPISPGDATRLVCRLCRARLVTPPPPCCARCGAPRLRTGRAETQACPECAPWPPALAFARSACVLEPPADRIVHQLKYRGWSAAARPMAERMADLALPDDAARQASIVVPVPTTRSRLRERGYNQAELLARAYAQRTGRELRLLLERRSSAASQTILQPVARGANVAGAFRIAGAAASFAGAHLLLVDDVLTTGATAVECARTLVAAGARCVSVVTFARAPTVRRVPT